MQIPNYFPEDPRYYLKTELEVRLGRRPFYSLRAFARDLEIGVSTLSEFLNGKTGLSKGRALALAKKLKLCVEHETHFLDLVESKFGASREKRAMAKERVRHRSQDPNSLISIEHFKFISDWYHYALLEYIELKGPQVNPGSAARELGLKKNQVVEALARLERLGLISKDQDHYRVRNDSSFTPHDKGSDALKVFHSQLLNKAKAALEKHESSDREFGHVIFTMSQSDLPAMKNDLRKAYLEIASKYNTNPKKDTIYCLGMQLHRLLETE